MEISIFLVKTTRESRETASDKLVPSLQFVPDSSTVPRYILVRENMPVRGLGVDSHNAGDWGRVRVCSKIDTSRICLSAHKTIEAGNENRLFTMDYIARLDFKLLFCVHSSKFGKCLLAQVSSVYRLRSVLICQKSPPSGHLEKKCQSKSRPMGPPD